MSIANRSVKQSMVDLEVFDVIQVPRRIEIQSIDKHIEARLSLIKLVSNLKNYETGIQNVRILQ